jgi:hypothetical protein
MPKGLYDVGIAISAYNHGAFGNSYNSQVIISGQVVAVAKGDVPDSGNDHDVAAIQLVVQ